MKKLNINWRVKWMVAAVTIGVCLLGANTSAVAQENWERGDEWRGQYKIGDKVQFSISGNASDFQICTVTENNPQAVMLVKCDEFKQWKAGMYIVHSEENLQGNNTEKTSNKQNNNTTRQNNPAAGLKIGEYACYGSSGRIMIGLGFKVLSGNRYTDLEGGNRGTFSVSGSTVKFRGGHLDGQTGRNLKNYSFAIGAQAECEPY